MTSLPDNLPSIAKAKLPEIYMRAKDTLAECSRIDQCQEWADKAEALASYAKQAEDSSLRQMADRIQARAIRRCGELLRALAPQETSPGRPAKNSNGTVTISRQQAAEDAGLSTRQKRTALRVANVPRSEFEAAVESSDPPTVTQLAEQGKRPAPKPLIDLKGRDPKEFNISLHAQGDMRIFAEMTARVDPSIVVRGAFDEDKPEMFEYMAAILTWLKRLKSELEKVK